MTDTDREAREHMRRCPEHEMTVNADDEWECLTCDQEEGSDPESTGWNDGPRSRTPRHPEWIA